MKHTNNSKKVVVAVIVIIVLIIAGWGVKQIHSSMRQNEITKQDQQRILDAQNADAQKRHEFAEKIAKPAIEVYQKQGTVLPSIVIAQAIQESNWGQSKLYQKANNIFGVKGDYKGQSISYYTDEYVSKDTPVKKGVKVVREGDQKKISIPAQFRKYPDVYTAVANHDRVTALNFIKKRNITSFEEQANLLQKSHYATDPNYAKSLINLIKQYNLQKYDKQAIK